MPELFNVLTPQEAYNRLEAHLSPTGRIERIATKGALGRVLAEDVLAPDNLTSFAKSVMDGYTVRVEDTFGASEALLTCPPKRSPVKMLVWKERYDLVIPRSSYESPLLEPLLGILRQPSFQADVESLVGYDTSQMGEMVYRSYK